jgi:hypothetical protein
MSIDLGMRQDELRTLRERLLTAAHDLVEGDHQQGELNSAPIAPKSSASRSRIRFAATASSAACCSRRSSESWSASTAARASYQ